MSSRGRIACVAVLVVSVIGIGYHLSRGREALNFERVVWIPDKPGRDGQLLLYVPEIEIGRDLSRKAELVLKYAPDAIREARQTASRVVFIIPSNTERTNASFSGFRVEQLMKYVSMPRDRALQQVKMHSWTSLPLPAIDAMLRR